MRILHLSSEASWRGGEQQLAYLVDDLHKLNIEVFIASKPHSEFEQYCEKMGWSSRPLQMRNSSDFRSALELRKLCKEQSIDLVHAHSSHSHSTAVLSYILGNRTPIILTRRVDFALKNNFFSKFKYTCSGIKKIACVSNAVREVVIDGTKNPQRSTTIYDAIDHKKFEPFIGSDWLRGAYDLDKSVTLIGNTSALAPHKDYFTFVQTAAHYVRDVDQNVRFFVIGQGEEEMAIKEYVQTLELTPYFIFTGFLKNIAEVLPSLDVFLMTSKTEGLGTSIIDACAAKVPVVATRAGGIPEVVRHMETGLTSEVGDSKGLADNLRLLRVDSELRNRLTESAYANALEFNTMHMAEEYVALYQEILSEK